MPKFTAATKVVLGLQMPTLPEHHVDALEVAEQEVRHVYDAAVVLRAEGREQRVAQRQRRDQDLTEPGPDVSHRFTSWAGR